MTDPYCHLLPGAASGQSPLQQGWWWGRLPLTVPPWLRLCPVLGTWRRNRRLRAEALPTGLAGQPPQCLLEVRPTALPLLATLPALPVGSLLGPRLPALQGLIQATRSARGVGL